MNYARYLVLRQNYDDDIDPTQECAIEANNFSLKAIPLIIQDDVDGFIDLVSSPEFNYDGNFPHARDRMYLSNYLYQPFFDELTGPSALCFAAFFNAEKIVEFILSLPDVSKNDAFHFACAGGSFNVMRTLFDQSECDLINKDSVRPLNIASYFGNVDIVKYLYSHGCPIISPNETYSSVNKAAFNGNINVLEFFKEVDPNLLKKMKEYKHPIISAAKGGQPECVNYFIQLGDLNKSTILSALKEACAKGSLSCVKILVNAFLNFKPAKKDDENKTKAKRKRNIRKRKKDDEYIPDRQRGKKNQKKIENEDDDEYDDEDDYESEEDKYEKELEKSNVLPSSIYTATIKNGHVDVLRYLFALNKSDQFDDFLLCAIDQIGIQKLSNILNPRRFYISFGKPESKNEERIKAHLIRQSSRAVDIAKFILSNAISNNYTDTFFDILIEKGDVDNAIYFLDQINFKITDSSNLTESQLEFFKLAILQSNSITIPLINRILNDKDIDFFEKNSYEKLLSKIINDDQASSNKKKYEESNEEYLEELRLMKDFHNYLSIISQKGYSFTADSALFLIEKNFPYYIIPEKKLKNANYYYFLMSPFFEASIKLGKYDYAYSFLKFEPISSLYSSLQTLFNEAEKIFNKDKIKDEKIDENQNKMQNENNTSYTNNELRALSYISDFNKEFSKGNANEKKREFNIFEYQCKNEEEMIIYQHYIKMIKAIIKMASEEPQIAILLCQNGLNKKWIIEQMKEDDETEINIDNTKENTRQSPFFGFHNKSMPSKNFEEKSINPLINIATNEIINSFYGYQLILKFSETFKYYINHGINVSQGTEYSEMLWKYIIENEKGYLAQILIANGEADSEEQLMDNSISLLDYAIQEKSVNIIFIFLNNAFYSQNSVAITNTSLIIDNINKEKVIKSKSHQQPNQKKINLQIIALLFKFVKFNYDQKKKKKLISELKARIRPEH